MIKVAFPTEDGTTLSRHLGRAPFYLVATIHSPQRVTLEQRPKPFHGSEAADPGHEHGPQGHGHASMFAPISDCQVLIAGGMGQPAYDCAVVKGLEVILAGERTIQAALDAYLAGNLVSDPRRVHQPHQALR